MEGLLIYFANIFITVDILGQVLMANQLREPIRCWYRAVYLSRVVTSYSSSGIESIGKPLLYGVLGSFTPLPCNP